MNTEISQRYLESVSNCEISYSFQSTFSFNP